MTVNTVWMLEQKNIALSDGSSLDEGVRGNGAKLVGNTLTIKNDDYLETRVADDDAHFQANDNKQQTLYGDQTINGVKYADGTKVTADYELTLYDEESDQSYTAYAYNVKPDNGLDTRVEGLVIQPDKDGGLPPVGIELLIIDAEQGPTGREQNPYTLYDEPPCFTPGTLILTGGGPRPVESLQPGDLVVTRDNGPQPLRWVARVRLTSADLSSRPALVPVRIMPGALGGGLPLRPLVLSPQHRVLIRGWQAELYFAQPEVLVPSVALLGDKAHRADSGRGGVDYLHLLFDRHEIIFAEGAEVESLLPDWLTDASLPPDLRDELALLRDAGPPVAAKGAVLPCLTVREAKVLA